MIVYFADRYMNILGQASTELPDGLTITDDLKPKILKPVLQSLNVESHLIKKHGHKLNRVQR